MQKHILQKLANFDSTMLEKSSSGLSATNLTNRENPYASYEKIQKEAYQNGLADGRAEISDQKLAHQTELEAALLELKDNFISLREKIEASHTTAVKNILANVLPILAEHTAGQEIADKVVFFAKEANTGNVVLTANETLAPLLGNALTNTDTTFIIKEDPHLPAGTVHLDWDNGQCHINMPEAVDACLKHLGATAEPSNGVDL